MTLLTRKFGKWFHEKLFLKWPNLSIRPLDQIWMGKVVDVIIITKLWWIGVISINDGVWRVSEDRIIVINNTIYLVIGIKG